MFILLEGANRDIARGSLNSNYLRLFCCGGWNRYNDVAMRLLFAIDAGKLRTSKVNDAI
jgi:hypothetical protein